jgi:hypothetical protein
MGKPIPALKVKNLDDEIAGRSIGIRMGVGRNNRITNCWFVGMDIGLLSQQQENFVVDGFYYRNTSHPVIDIRSKNPRFRNVRPF